MLKIVLAPDSFKGSLTAEQAAEAMAAGVADYDETIETVLLPAADGGEGTMSSLVRSTNGKTVEAAVQDPFGRMITARFGVLGDGETCVIELAEASGLTLLKDSEKDPLTASTFGTGQLILRALDTGYRKFIVGLGGSATNDAGVGMLRALGMKFLRGNGEEVVEGPASLLQLQTIDPSGFDRRVAQSEFIIASDVDNPFIGPAGASAVFGPQKGASQETVQLLDKSLAVFADVVQQQMGIALHGKKGAGAAGGTGGAFQAFFPGKTKTGIEVVLEAMNFEERTAEADLVITGEGKTDLQTLSGKTPFGIAKACKRQEIPVILLSGAIDAASVENLSGFFQEVHAVVGGNVTTVQSMQRPAHFLRLKTAAVLKDWQNRHFQDRH